MLNGAAKFEKIGEMQRVYAALKRDYESWEKEFRSYRDLYEKARRNGTIKWGEGFRLTHPRPVAHPEWAATAFAAKYIGMETIEIRFLGCKSCEGSDYPYYLGTYLKIAYIYNYFLKPNGWLISPVVESYEHVGRGKYASSVKCRIISKTRAEMEGITDEFRDHMPEPWPEFPEEMKAQIQDLIDRRDKDPDRREDMDDFDPADELEEAVKKVLEETDPKEILDQEEKDKIQKESNPAPVKKTSSCCCGTKGCTCGKTSVAKPLPKKNPGK